MHLVVVESPAKCKKIAGFLGPGFKVLATMGHIRALEEDLDAIGLDRDFEPRFRFLKEKAKATKPIMDAAAGIDTIYLAADDDREGEAIAYSVACLLKRDPLTLPRIVFHEITESAVKNAVANPRRINMNIVYAQQARSILDMMVGFTISPLLWKHVARTLSAGRCQTPALRLVYDREESIKAHTTNTSWCLQGNFHMGKVTIQAKMNDELEDQESSLNYLENIHTDNKATITSVTESHWTLNAPKPLITSTLQQEASALHGVNPKVTMKIAQALYEAGHITYMRTDHAILCDEAVRAAQAWVKEKHGDAYVAAAPAVQKTKKKTKAEPETPQAQEAHEAIRPTHMELEELTDEWTPMDRKIYALIRRRAIQSVMSAAKGKNKVITLLLADEEFLWSTSLRKTDFYGWQILGKTANLDSDDEAQDTPWDKLDSLTKGAALTWSSLESYPKRSKPSPRFTEATLIRELESKGIGRPSTFASLIDTLFDKLYIEKQDISGVKITNTKYTLTPSQWPPVQTTSEAILGAEKGKLVPSALGISVLTFCIREFPQLFAYDFTALMESRLDRIAKGDDQWKQLCRDTWGSYKESHDRLKSAASLPSTSEKVKDFGRGFKAVMSKKGPLLVQENPEPQKATFYSFPPNVSIMDITEEEARAWILKIATDSIFGHAGTEPIYKKKGPYGFYLQMGERRIPFVEGETLAQVILRLQAAAQPPAVKIGLYSFGIGQYGPYMFKNDLKTRKFVSIPKTIDPKTLTPDEADALYKRLSEAASRGGRGGRGGRGRGRGSGR